MSDIIRIDKHIKGKKFHHIRSTARNEASARCCQAAPLSPNQASLANGYKLGSDSVVRHLIIGLDLRFGHPPHTAPAGLPNPAAGLDLPIQAPTKTIRPADRAFARFFCESKAFFQKSPMVSSDLLAEPLSAFFVRRRSGHEECSVQIEKSEPKNRFFQKSDPET